MPSDVYKQLCAFGLSGKSVVDQLKRPDGQWWIDKALSAICDDHYELIPNRQETGLYLARFWLTPPVARSAGPGWRFANSLVLHCFAAGDDDGALHDHPCAFSTQILSGAYHERLLPENREQGRFAFGLSLADCPVTRRAAGDFLLRSADTLHAVEDPEPGTWTLVQTGPVVQSWGFHPPGELWMENETFLARARAKQAPTRVIRKDVA